MTECKATDCTGVARTRGYCAKHYARYLRTGQVDTAREWTPGGKICTAEGCNENANARDLCPTHYARARRGVEVDGPMRAKPIGGTCTIEGCESVIHGLGLCTTHYWRQKRGYEMEAPIQGRTPRAEVCTVADCDKKVNAANLCSTHYGRKKAGESDWDRPIKKKAPDGEGHLNDKGYRMVRHNGRMMGKHLVEFEKVLGRRVRTEAPYKENVHHKNGNRDDNRTDGPPVMTPDGKYLTGNLEMWSQSQPPGQEIGPKLDWGMEMLAEYGAHMDAARFARFEEMVEAVRSARVVLEGMVKE